MVTSIRSTSSLVLSVVLLLSISSLGKSATLATQSAGSGVSSGLADSDSGRSPEESESIPWASLAGHLAMQGQTLASLSLCDCPDDIGDWESSRVVAQVIENTFYLWEEYDLMAGDDLCMCIVMREPEPGPLTAEQSRVLLTGSLLWKQSTLYKGGESPQKSGLLRAQGIIGTDDRTRITNTQVYPWNTHCYLESEFAGNTDYPSTGTGCLIGPLVVLTCAHIIYSEELGSYTAGMLAVPGLTQNSKDGPLVMPYGMRGLVDYRVSPDYKPGYASEDYGVVFLDRPVPGINTYLPLQFSSGLAKGDALHIAGYPGKVKLGTLDADENSYALWSGSGSVSQVYTKYLTYNTDTSGGDSGAPVRSGDASVMDPYRIVGVHGGTVLTGVANAGARLGSHNQARITEWMKWTRTVLFEDTFSSQTIDSAKWAIVSGATVDGQGSFETSPSRSLRLNGEDSIQSIPIDLSSYSGVTLTYFYERRGGGESPDSGDDLVVEYSLNGSKWVELDRQAGSGPDMALYEFVKIDLPDQARKAGFRLRIRSAGDPPDSDDWFVDDVTIAAAPSETASIAGVWTLNYHWGAGSNGGQVTITFDSDGTFSTSQGSGGTWSQSGDSVSWTYSSGTRYSGTLTSSTAMSGTMVSYLGSSGTWDAVKKP